MTILQFDVSLSSKISTSRISLRAKISRHTAQDAPERFKTPEHIQQISLRSKSSWRRKICMLSFRARDVDISPGADGQWRRLPYKVIFPIYGYMEPSLSQ